MYLYQRQIDGCLEIRAMEREMTSCSSSKSILKSCMERDFALYLLNNQACDVT